MWATNRHRNPGYPGLDDSNIVNNTVKMLIDLGLSGYGSRNVAHNNLSIEPKDVVFA